MYDVSREWLTTAAPMSRRTLLCTSLITLPETIRIWRWFIRVDLWGSLSVQTGFVFSTYSGLQFARQPEQLAPAAPAETTDGAQKQISQF